MTRPVTMRRLILLAIWLLFGALPAGAASAPPSSVLPPPAPQAAPAPVPGVTCVDARNSPDYVPGGEVQGRPVAPADLPGSSTDVQIDTEVYAELRSSNRQLRGVGVVANLPGLQARNPCPPSAPPASAAKH
jgi:hypothetical protein